MMIPHKLEIFAARKPKETKWWTFLFMWNSYIDTEAEGTLGALEYLYVVCISTAVTRVWIKFQGYCLLLSIVENNS